MNFIKLPRSTTPISANKRILPQMTRTPWPELKFRKEYQNHFNWNPLLFLNGAFYDKDVQLTSKQFRHVLSDIELWIIEHGEFSKIHMCLQNLSGWHLIKQRETMHFATKYSIALLKSIIWSKWVFRLHWFHWHKL
jgi:hypothetical protein